MSRCDCFFIGSDHRLLCQSPIVAYMLRDNDEPKYCRFCEMNINIGHWNEHRQSKRHKKYKHRRWPLEQQRTKDAEEWITYFMKYGTTSFVVKAQICASGREREFKFPSSDAPLWILEYAIRAWVWETCEEEEHLFIGVHLVVGESTFGDVFDHRPPEMSEKIALSSIFVNVATDGEYVVQVVLDTERSQEQAR